MLQGRGRKFGRTPAAGTQISPAARGSPHRCAAAPPRTPVTSAPPPAEPSRSTRRTAGAGGPDCAGGRPAGHPVAGGAGVAGGGDRRSGQADQLLTPPPAGSAARCGEPAGPTDGGRKADREGSKAGARAAACEARRRASGRRRSPARRCERTRRSVARRYRHRVKVLRHACGLLTSLNAGLRTSGLVIKRVYLVRVGWHRCRMLVTRGVVRTGVSCLRAPAAAVETTAVAATVEKGWDPRKFVSDRMRRFLLRSANAKSRDAIYLACCWL